MTTLNVQFSNDGAVSGSTHTLSTYVVPSGTDKILMVGVCQEGGAAVTGVTHNGVAMTQRAIEAHSGGSNTSYLYDLQLGATTPTGDIVATFGSSPGGAGINAWVEDGLVQQVPEATNSAEGTSSPIDTAITTITNGAVIVDVLCGGTTGAPSITQGPDQVEDVSETVGGTGFQQGGSHRVAGAAGSHTLGWSAASVNRLCHCLAAYEVTATGLSIPIIMRDRRMRIN